jgi:multidrug resistance efflux pump
VQRLPVRIEIDPRDASSVQADELRSGLSANVVVDTCHRRSFFGLHLKELGEVLTADAEHQ